MHQLKLIVQTLGHPSDKDLAFINNKRYIRGIPRVTPKPLNVLFPTASKDAINMLKNMLQFNPKKRISAEDALNHSWIRHLNSPKSATEDLCPRKFSPVRRNCVET